MKEVEFKVHKDPIKRYEHFKDLFKLSVTRINYYYSTDTCVHCQRGSSLHMAQVAKAGVDEIVIWKGYKGIDDVGEWFRMLMEDGAIVMDDFGNFMSPALFLRLTEHIPNVAIDFDLDE